MKTLKKIVSLIFVTAIFITSCSSVFAVELKNPLKIYVDGSVKVSGDGSLENPLASIEEAKMAVRQLKNANNYPKDGVEVIIRGGEYPISESIAFNEEDSGLENAPVIYKAYPTEKVNIVGGTAIKLGDFSVSDDSRITESVKGKVYSYNLKDAGIAPYDRLYCTGHSQYAMWQVFPKDFPSQADSLATPEVFYNDNPITLARYPNGDEYLRVGEVVQAGDRISVEWEAGRKDWPDSVYEMKNMIFKSSVTAEQLKRWQAENEGWLFGYWYWDWSEQTTPIKSIKPEEGIIETLWPSAFGLQANQRFYAYNMLCELDIPGEWYYDKESGEFFIYPTDNNKDSEIMLGFSSNDLIKMDNCSNIEIHNIDVMATRRNGISVNNGYNIKIFGCTVKNVSGMGIIFSEGNGNNNTIDSCHVYNTGGRGIYLHTGDIYTITYGNSVVQNCWIHDFARLNRTYHGGISIAGAGNTARFNTIHSGPHVGFQFGGADTIIEYNEVYDVLQESADMGAFYGGRNMYSRGIIFRGNIVRDCVSNSDHVGQYGIYFDDCMSGNTVTGNLFYNLSSPVFVNGGRDTTVTGNTFVNVDDAITFSAIGKMYGMDYMYNTFKIVPGGWHTKDPWTKYPHLSTLLEDEDPLAPKDNVLKDNINCNIKDDYFDIDLYGATEAQMYEWSELGKGITVNMSDFVNPEMGDYRLKIDVSDKLPDYEAYDYHKAGTITARLKASLSDDAVVVKIGSPVSYVNWNQKLIDENNIDVTPVIKDNITYVPIRFIAEMLGSKVEYNDGVVSINYNGSVLSLPIGSDVATIDGKTEQMTGKCFIENGRTLVPLRSVGNMFQKEVFWDDRGLIVVGNEIPELDEDMIKNLIDRL